MWGQYANEHIMHKTIFTVKFSDIDMPSCDGSLSVLQTKGLTLLFKRDALCLCTSSFNHLNKVWIPCTRLLEVRTEIWSLQGVQCIILQLLVFKNFTDSCLPNLFENILAMNAAKAYWILPINSLCVHEWKRKWILWNFLWIFVLLKQQIISHE